MKLYKYPAVFVLLNALVFPAFAQNTEAPAKEESTEQNTEAGESATEVSSAIPHMETLATETNQVSYAIGVNIARNFQQNYPNVNIDFVVLGLRDVMGGGRLKMNEDLINAGIVKFSEEASRISHERVESLTEKNLENAEKFLEMNGKKDDVVTTPSGLQYRVISRGNGPKPGPNATVTFNCTTRLLGGAVIDSTLTQGGKPIVRNLASAIPAWKESLSAMNLGSKWEIYAHPKLAFGEKGAKNVGPNDLLIFTVELLAFD